MIRVASLCFRGGKNGSGDSWPFLGVPARLPLQFDFSRWPLTGKRYLSCIPGPRRELKEPQPTSISDVVLIASTPYFVSSHTQVATIKKQRVHENKEDPQKKKNKAGDGWHQDETLTDNFPKWTVFVLFECLPALALSACNC